MGVAAWAACRECRVCVVTHFTFHAENVNIAQMENESDFQNALSVFAHYGFRKTSMDDLARAIGVSRQTLYNRFKTKEAVRDWAVEGFSRQMLSRAAAELEDDTASTAQCLARAFDRWKGDHIAIIRAAPHGAEIIEIGIEALKNAKSNPLAEFDRRLVDFLVKRKTCANRKRAEDVVHVLEMASKGLMVTAENPEAFAAGMKRVVGTLL